MAMHFNFVQRQAVDFENDSRSLYNCYVNAPGEGWNDDIYKSYLPYVRYVKRQSDEITKTIADFAKMEGQVTDRPLMKNKAAREKLEEELRKIK